MVPIERSTKQSIGIVERRMDNGESPIYIIIISVSKTINDLELQLENQRTKIGLSSNILDLSGLQESKFNEEGLPFVDIMEEYNSDDERKINNKLKRKKLLKISAKILLK
ncbi:unnamed protein product [Rhizophagus irregularis]|nr:unnamed protein product [Rhizophagus irregularis]